MQTLLLGVTIVGMSILLAHLGLRLVRRKVPLPVLETQHEVAGFIIGVLGAIYAVLLAFVVVVVWNQFEDAKSTVEKEANQLHDLSRIAQGFSNPVRQRMLERRPILRGRDKRPKVIVQEARLRVAIDRRHAGSRTQYLEKRVRVGHIDSA